MEVAFCLRGWLALIMQLVSIGFDDQTWYAFENKSSRETTKRYGLAAVGTKLIVTTVAALHSRRSAMDEKV